MTDVGIFQNIQEPTRNETVSVGTSSVVVSESRNEDNSRKDIILRNTSSSSLDIITINVGFALAVANEGIVLKQNESVMFSSEAGYKAPNNVISAICATANGQLSIFER